MDSIIMEATIEFYEIVENVTVSFEESNESISIEITETEKVSSVEFQELGVPGISGKSNYQIAIQNGFIGSEIQWLEAQKNIDGGLIF